MFLFCVLLSACVASIVTSVVCLRKKRACEERYRRVEQEAQYVLPDSRNEYLRSRLQTALAVSEETRTPSDAKFLHARKLLYALSEKRLSGADSLLLHKLQKEVGRYSTKEYFSVYEKSEIADALGKLLILCAKYEI